MLLQLGRSCNYRDILDMLKKEDWRRSRPRPPDPPYPKPPLSFAILFLHLSLRGSENSKV